MRILATIAFSFAAATLAAVCLPWDGWQLYAASVLLLLAVVLLPLKRVFSAHPTLRLRLLVVVFSASAALVWQCAYHQMFVARLRRSTGRCVPFPEQCWSILLKRIRAQK